VPQGRPDFVVGLDTSPGRAKAYFDERIAGVRHLLEHLVDEAAFERVEIQSFFRQLRHIDPYRVFGFFWKEPALRLSRPSA
jgi:hypothetical protein